jgi:AAA domain
LEFYLTSLVLSFKKETVTIPFTGVSYFWGQMGAGKTSIARLIDYCLGGSIELSPALQSEFVSATLNLKLQKGDLQLERGRDTNLIVARWGSKDEAMQVAIPARDANGEVVPGTGIENLSDLIFWMSSLTPPRVRTSKLRADSETKRLSIRNLLWYCYLDQDEIDSSFFHLDSSNQFSRLASLDVVRFVIGYHDEHILEIEAQLDALRIDRTVTLASLESLSRVLRDVGVESEMEIQGRVRELRQAAEQIAADITEQRQLAVGDRTTEHASDRLKIKAQRLSQQITSLDEAIADLLQARDRDSRHLHEIETLSLKFRRSQSARAVLSGVAFHTCPRCTQSLPDRSDDNCYVCGQVEMDNVNDSADDALVQRDIKSRTEELREIIRRHDESLTKLRRDREAHELEKRRVERERNETSQRFDSAYLSSMLTKERERSALLQQADSLEAMVRFPQMLEAQRQKVNNVQAQEIGLRSRLKEAREAAEKDATNINTLKDLFLDCLVRSEVPGIKANDSVEISASSFLPELHSPGVADTTIASFSTLSSGGKKTLFKCCFAVAMHRLAVQVGAPLPEMMIIDSPMKNISERENREQFKGFYNLIYQLKADELKNTQFILIDKEYTPPRRDLKLRVSNRHMKPNDPSKPSDRENSPLIPYYYGN